MIARWFAPCSVGAGTARDTPFAAATDTRTLSNPRAGRQSGEASDAVQSGSLIDPFVSQVCERWALYRLLEPGRRSVASTDELWPTWLGRFLGIHMLAAISKKVHELHRIDGLEGSARYRLRRFAREGGAA